MASGRLSAGPSSRRSTAVIREMGAETVTGGAEGEKRKPRIEKSLGLEGGKGGVCKACGLVID